MPFPDVEKSFSSSSLWQFSGPAEGDPTPDIVEVCASVDEVIVWFFNTFTNPDTKYPSGSAPWWPGGGASVGDPILICKVDIPRIFDIRGLRVDTIQLIVPAGASAVVSCWKRR